MDAFEARHRRDDGLYRTRVSNTGDILDDTPWVYDQAFVLFAFAEVAAADLDREIMSARAHRLIQAMNRLRHPAGGWREAGDQPFQANAHMHLLEAFMAWEVLEPDGPWTALADEVVSLARSCFINADRGFIREFYRTDWTPAAGTDGTLIEPGHQFEWAWLLMRWSVRRDQAWAMSAATKLYDVGVRGVDVRRGVAVDALDDDFTVRSETARLWPQTERLKAALLLAQLSEGVERDRLVTDARTALGALLRYVQPSGLWHDRLEADGRFRDEPAPASSLYHIMVAAEQLRALSPRFEVWGRQ